MHEVRASQERKIVKERERQGRLEGNKCGGEIWGDCSEKGITLSRLDEVREKDWQTLGLPWWSSG